MESTELHLQLFDPNDSCMHTTVSVNAVCRGPHPGLNTVLACEVPACVPPPEVVVPALGHEWRVLKATCLQLGVRPLAGNHGTLEMGVLKEED